MKKTFATIALLIASAGALVMPAAAESRNYRDVRHDTHVVVVHRGNRAPVRVIRKTSRITTRRVEAGRR